MRINDATWAAEHPGKLPGQHVRQIRLDAGVTLQDFAKEAKRCGLGWAPARVSDLESGRVDAKLDTIVKVAQTLANLLGRPVTLAELLGGHPYAALLRGEPVQPEQADATPTDVARRGGYESVEQAAEDLGVEPDQAAAVLLAYEDTGLVDQRAASELGLSVRDLTIYSFRLWGSNFTAERDRRGGPGAHAAKLGEATRAMRAEIREHLDH